MERILLHVSSKQCLVMKLKGVPVKLDIAYNFYGDDPDYRFYFVLAYTISDQTELIFRGEMDGTLLKKMVKVILLV